MLMGRMDRYDSDEWEGQQSVFGQQTVQYFFELDLSLLIRHCELPLRHFEML